MSVKKLIPFILLLTTLQVSAQKKGFIAVSGGFSSPLGKYADNTLDVSKLFKFLDGDLFTNVNPMGSGNELTPTDEVNFFGNNGFAKTGFQFGADGAYYFFKNFGIAGSFYFGKNNFDTKPLNSILSAASNIQGSETKMDFTAGAYKYYTGMAGPVFSVKHERLSLDLRVLAGIAFTSYPAKDITIKNTAPPGQDPFSGQTIVVSLNANEGEAFAMAFGSNIRYDLNNKFAVFVKPELLYWQQKYTESFSGSVSFLSMRLTKPTENTIPVTVFNTSFGIAYQFSLDK
jgi:hypothetical protein